MAMYWLWCLSVNVVNLQTEPAYASESEIIDPQVIETAEAEPKVHIVTATTTAPPAPTTTTTTAAPVPTVPTTTLPPPTVTPTVPPAPTPPTTAVEGGQQRSVNSTAYCLQGTMANGERVHNGAVASKILPRGSSWRVLNGPLAGNVYTVKDTGPSAYFDIWMSSCDAANQYGRREIQIEEV